MTIAIVLGLGLTSFADPNNGGGLFQRGQEANYSNGNTRDGAVPMLPNAHGLPGNQDANGPLGSGIAVMLGLGGAYLVAKKRKEE